MTWSLTPAEISRAGTKSKPQLYKHKLQKTKDLPKTWGLRGEQLKISDKKNTSGPDQTTPWNTRPLEKLLKRDLVTRQKKTDEKVKGAFR